MGIELSVGWTCRRVIKRIFGSEELRAELFVSAIVSVDYIVSFSVDRAAYAVGASGLNVDVSLLATR